MQLMGNRSLAWVLRWITDIAFAGLLILFAVVLVVLAVERSPWGSGTRQGSVGLDLKLPTEILEPAAAGVSVFNLQSMRTTIHYTTEEISLPEVVGVFSYTIIFFSILLWILWQVRQLLASLVALEPLSFTNARRFRIIGLLMVFKVTAEPIWDAFGYLGLQTLFPLIPPRGLFGLYVAHFNAQNLVIALLIVLMAEVLRLAAEHRLDSEAVI